MSMRGRRRLDCRMGSDGGLTLRKGAAQRNLRRILPIEAPLTPSLSPRGEGVGPRTGWQQQRSSRGVSSGGACLLRVCLVVLRRAVVLFGGRRGKFGRAGGGERGG